MSSIRNSPIFVMGPEDLYFLLDSTSISLLEDSTINDDNRYAQWHKFLERNTAKGFVKPNGSPSAELKKAILPIQNHTIEVGLTNEYQDVNRANVKAAFYSSDKGTTFIKRLDDRGQKFVLKHMADEEMREATLIKEFGLCGFRFSDEPFSCKFDEETARMLFEPGLDRDPYAFRRMVRTMGLDFSHLALARGTLHQEDRFVIIATKKTAKYNKPSTTYVVMGSPKLGTMVKSHRQVVLVFSQARTVSTRIERLAEQSLWDYLTRFN